MQRIHADPQDQPASLQLSCVITLACMGCDNLLWAAPTGQFTASVANSIMRFHTQTDRRTDGLIIIHCSADKCVLVARRWLAVECRRRLAVSLSIIDKQQ